MCRLELDCNCDFILIYYKFKCSLSIIPNIGYFLSCSLSRFLLTLSTRYTQFIDHTLLCVSLTLQIDNNECNYNQNDGLESEYLTSSEGVDRQFQRSVISRMRCGVQANMTGSHDFGALVRPSDCIPPGYQHGNTTPLLFEVSLFRDTNVWTHETTNYFFVHLG